MATARKTTDNKNKRKGPRKLPAYTDDELLSAAESLHAFLGFTLEHRDLSRGQAQRLRETLAFWLNNARPPDGKAAALVQCAVMLTRGADIETQARMAELIRRDGKVLSRVAIKRELARAGKTEIGRAYSVFKILARGARCRPTFDGNRMPRGELRALFDRFLV